MLKTTASLAQRCRPTQLESIVGQEHLLAPGKPLYRMIQQKQLHSMILWGPPGCGKTTIAKVISLQAEIPFVSLSAVLDNISIVRKAIQQAEENEVKPTILFVDEVHRFNKAQQDAFLPHIENGTILFMGATTENPSFAINRALLSRVRVHLLHPLSDQDLQQALRSGIAQLQSELNITIECDTEIIQALVDSSGADARRLLDILEIACQQAGDRDKGKSEEKSESDGSSDSKNISITKDDVKTAVGYLYQDFDRGGDIWYDQISALHKSIRGSSPDGALYWCCRMIAGGCDPLYIARRLLAIASEDVGNADPRALPLALAAWQTFERLGAYEGERAIAHACIYLAMAPKSNSIDTALKKARQLVQQTGNYPVPHHLRNAPTRLMKQLGYGKEYRYAHDEPDNYAAGECYLPEELEGVCFYEPSENGLEIKINEKLKRLRALDSQSEHRRYHTK